MRKDSNNRIGRYSFLFFLLLILLMLYLFSQGGKEEGSMTYKQFQTAVDGKKVESVSIHQNRSVPTGRLSVKLKDKDEVKVVNVPDVSTVASYLDRKDVPYEMDNVQEESWFVSSVLPMLVMVFVAFMVIMMLSRQGGGGAQAMNFGKSRARMTDPKDKKVTFAQVAGLH